MMPLSDLKTTRLVIVRESIFSVDLLLSPSPGFGCTRLSCVNSLMVLSMDSVLMVLDLSQQPPSLQAHAVASTEPASGCNVHWRWCSASLFLRRQTSILFLRKRGRLAVYPAGTTDFRLSGGWFEYDNSLKTRNDHYLGFLEARVFTPFIKFLLSEDIFTVFSCVFVCFPSFFFSCVWNLDEFIFSLSLSTRVFFVPKSFLCPKENSCAGAEGELKD